MPDQLKVIGDGAFANCKKFVAIEIPATVEKIGSQAFWRLTLSTVKSNIKEPFPIDERVFYDASGKEFTSATLVVPKGTEAKYKATKGWNKFKNIETGIVKPSIGTDGQPFDVYNLQGRKVRRQVTSLDGLPKGVYIVNGNKVVRR